MSLINDALKRAAEAEKRQTGSRSRRRAPKGAEELGPMVHAKPVKSRRDMLAITPAFGLIMLIIMMAGLSSFLLHKWWTQNRPFKLDVPEGKSALELMIIPDARLAQKTKSPRVVKTEIEDETGGSQTNSLATTTTNAVAATNAVATTNVVITPPVVRVAQNAATNSLPSGPLLATANPPLTKAPLPEPPKPPTTPATNSVPVPVKLPEPKPKPTVTVPVIVRPRSPEGNKPRAQIDAELAERDRTRANESTNASIAIVPTRVPKKTIEFPEIKIRGIIIKQDSGMADVNGKIISIGDVVSGVELVEISKEYLIFKTNGVSQKFFIAQ